jgi:DNA-binding transcriptional ArsR family regulator
VQTTTRHPLPELVDRRKVAAARAGMPTEDVRLDAVEVFKVLSSPVRLCIIHALAHDELSVGDLSRALDLSLSVASHQLALLRRMKLVAARDEGRLTFYRATDDFVGHLVHDCLAHVGERLGVPGTPHHHGHRASPTSRSRERVAVAGAKTGLAHQSARPKRRSRR